MKARRTSVAKRQIIRQPRTLQAAKRLEREQHNKCKERICKLLQAHGYRRLDHNTSPEHRSFICEYAFNDQRTTEGYIFDVAVFADKPLYIELHDPSHYKPEVRARDAAKEGAANRVGVRVFAIWYWQMDKDSDAALWKSIERQMRTRKLLPG